MKRSRLLLTVSGLLLVFTVFATAPVAYGGGKSGNNSSSNQARSNSSHGGASHGSGGSSSHAGGNNGTPPPVTNGSLQAVKLSNLSNQPLENIDIRFSGKDAGDFSQTNDCGGELAGGGSCTISVVFLPKSAGAKSATMEVSTSGGGKVVYLTGTGT